MYDHILNGLYRHHNITTDSGKAQFLQGLQPSALALFNGYRNQNVAINYAPIDMQAAYLIRYYPQYSQIIFKILEKQRLANQQLPFNQQNLQGCFFGGGPAPEVYGWIDFLRTHHAIATNLNAYVFDIYANAWTFSRQIGANSIIPPILGTKQLNLHGINFDLTAQNAVAIVQNYVANSQIVVFQNCFNELPVNTHLTVKTNVIEILRNMPQNSILLITDLSGYDAVTTLITDIQSEVVRLNIGNVLSNITEPIVTFDGLNKYAMPQIIRDNLLTGVPYQIENGLIPRRYVKFKHIAIRKS